MRTLCVLVKAPNSTGGFWIVELQAKDAVVDSGTKLLRISDDNGIVGEFSLEALVGWHWKQD